MTDEAVAWFSAAVAQPRTPLSVWARHLRLHVAAWNDGDTHKPPLLLVHGFRAHAQWWDHIAPSFVAQWRVYALDFSGMGRSAWREHYTRQGFTDDVVTVARWLKERAPGQALAVVGHSYGGSRLLDACAQQLSGLADVMRKGLQREATERAMASTPPTLTLQIPALGTAAWQVSAAA